GMNGSGNEAPIVIAVPKGRVLHQAVELFARAGYDLSETLGRSRKLLYDCGPVRVLVLRAGDVPTYVDHGAADAGVAGVDVLEEEEPALYQPLDLGIGACRMVVAEPESRPIEVSSQIHLRVATKYPVIARRYFQRSGLTAEIIKLSGSVELGPLTGLA